MEILGDHYIETKRCKYYQYFFWFLNLLYYFYALASFFIVTRANCLNDWWWYGRLLVLDKDLHCKTKSGKENTIDFSSFSYNERINNSIGRLFSFILVQIGL